jgi:hypothetical protein
MSELTTDVPVASVYANRSNRLFGCPGIRLTVFPEISTFRVDVWIAELK